MKPNCRFMRDGEEDLVAELIRQLPRDIGLQVVPKATGKNIRDAKGIAQVTVAEQTGQLNAVCLWAKTYSSWRGMVGIYISDLYVLPGARGQRLGEMLLRFTASEAQKQGAGFIKLEVDVTNRNAQRFYERAGFVHKPDDQFYVLEPAGFNIFAKEVSS